MQEHKMKANNHNKKNSKLYNHNYHYPKANHHKYSKITHQHRHLIEGLQENYMYYLLVCQNLDVI